jgi:hypothetical protein
MGQVSQNPQALILDLMCATHPPFFYGEVIWK